MNAQQVRQRIRSIWRALDSDQRWALFRDLADEVAPAVFEDLTSPDQAEMFELVDDDKKRRLVLALAPDDVVDLLQALSPQSRASVVNLLDQSERREIQELSRYPAEQAGGLMTPRFLPLRQEQTAGQALADVRQGARGEVETLSSLFVVDTDGRLVGVLPLRKLLAADDGAVVAELMETDFLSASVSTDREALGRLFTDHGLTLLPVIDEQRVLMGIVTVDDIAEAVQEEVTEDIQKMGGLEVLEAPYLRLALGALIRKRAGWLAVLFVGEMLTATAMSHYENEIAQAVILAVFIPLIISSGGNSGSQACTLIIRAMALDEVRLCDWLRVAGRELVSGLCLGAILGVIGFIGILLWQRLFGTYGPDAGLLALTVALSLVGVVTFGTMGGALLPFLLRRLGFDPASASAPFVATLVDVTGLIIYFSVASLTLAHLLH